MRQALSDHERSLVRYVARLLGDEEAAREVVQEAYLRLWRASGESDPRPGADGHLRPWLFTVCRNRALDALRREGRMRTMELDEAARAPSPRPGPSEQATP